MHTGLLYLVRPELLIANRAVRDAIEQLVASPGSGGLDVKVVQRWQWQKQPAMDQAKVLLAEGRVVRVRNVSFFGISLILKK